MLNLLFGSSSFDSSFGVSDRLACWEVDGGLFCVDLEVSKDERNKLSDRRIFYVKKSEFEGRI